MIYRYFLPLVALLLSGSEVTLSGNILVLPAEYSHWHNMRVIVEELVARNHSVTVLVHSASPTVKPSQKDNFKYIVYKVNVEEQDVHAIWQTMFHSWVNPNTTGIQMLYMFWNMMSTFQSCLEEVCEGMLLNEQLMTSLRESHFDVILYDPVTPCYELLSETLDLPRVVSIRASIAYSWERMCGQLPTPPSYVPAVAAHGHLTDRMNFIERVENMLLYAANTAIYKVIMEFVFDKYYSKIMGKPTSLCDTMGKADIWLIRTYWDLEYPRPLLPNFKFVGGLHCKPAKPLPKVRPPSWLPRWYWMFLEFRNSQPGPEVPSALNLFGSTLTSVQEQLSKQVFVLGAGKTVKYAEQLIPQDQEMEEFVQSSGDHDIVVFSLGSILRNITKERANTIASAFGQIPQKVFWRYSGEKPDTLAPNTRLYEWLPQNDLLGHPKTNAFITHGGTNGIYEAIYHGVPIIGIPLLGDQSDNLFHMKTKGAAVLLDFHKMDTEELKEALTEVIRNPLYKEGIMRLSRIHHDQPMKPLDQAVYWIEFLIRNKGAKHLRVEAHNLTWYQYHCLDVAAFLFSIVAFVTFVFVKTCTLLFRKCCRKTSAKSKKE